jgi:hypothetical protein
MESKPGYFYVGTRSISEDHTLTTSIYLSSDPNPPERIQEEQDETQIISAPPNNFHEIQRAFFNQMHAFLDVLPAGASLVPALRSAWVEVFKKQALEKHSSDCHSHEDWKIFEIPDEFRSEINRDLNKSRRTRDAFLIFPQLMLLGLVSQFDAYMGGLLRIAISKRPDIIQKSQKNFPASEVFQYSDIEAFKEAVVEKEIESFLRKSHEEQFS